jgi:hypothetical protein
MFRRRRGALDAAAMAVEMLSKRRRNRRTLTAFKGFVGSRSIATTGPRLSRHYTRREHRPDATHLDARRRP